MTILMIAIYFEYKAKMLIVRRESKMSVILLLTNGSTRVIIKTIISHHERSRETS